MGILENKIVIKQPTNNASIQFPRKYFISHSVRDVKYTESIVDILST